MSEAPLVLVSKRPTVPLYLISLAPETLAFKYLLMVNRILEAPEATTAQLSVIRSKDLIEHAPEILKSESVAVPDKLILEAPLAPTFKLLTFIGPLISLAPEMLTSNLSDMIGSTKETLQAPETVNFCKSFTVM